ncbi:MAG: hypothetical protein FWD36_01055 [Treponema sp.]|nr:hypothetical protein [Treponema sp.]
MRQIPFRHWILPLLLVLAALSGALPSGAQELYAPSLMGPSLRGVPLDHTAYTIIAMGVMRGIILPPPSAKPWSERTVKKLLQEMLDSPGQALSAKEADTVAFALHSFERQNMVGIGWESDFSLEMPDIAEKGVNTLKLYAGSDMTDFLSWNLTAFWTLVYPAGHDDIAFDYGLEGELNSAFFDERLQLRLGRIRRDWGSGPSGTSLFINAHTCPFTALEGTVSPFSWLHISILGGVLEQFREDIRRPDDPFPNVLSAAQIELNPFRYIHLGMGGTALLRNEPNAAFFANLELRLPGLFALWGSLFVDNLNGSLENFSIMHTNSYAYQAGIRANIHWLPFAAFTMRYTKIEPYCYGGEWRYPASAFVNRGESLGYYLPPNSDELLLRFDSMLFPAVTAHAQLQRIRRGVDYGDGAVAGSSLREPLDDPYSVKYFLMDGVYRWDNVIKAGGSYQFRRSGAASVFVTAETGVVMTRFTINGNAGPGNEADYESLDNSVYRAINRFIFAIGLKLFY